MRRYSDIIVYILSFFSAVYGYNYFFGKLQEDRKPRIYPGLEFSFDRKLTILQPPTELRKADLRNIVGLTSRQMDADTWLKEVEKSSKILQQRQKTGKKLPWLSCNR